MKSILILGAESDVGREISAIYMRKGYYVIMASRHSETYYFDAVDFDSHRTFYDSLEPKPVGVVSVFGYMGEQTISEKSFEETQKVMNANYCGQVSILTIIANDFEKKQQGFIIGISSVAGNRGRMSNYIYGSAKAAFTAYLSGLRNRLWHSGVHVMTVLPGFMDTKMTAHLNLPRLLTALPNDAARQIVDAQEQKKDILYVKPIWRYIMFIIECIPESVFKRLRL